MSTIDRDELLSEIEAATGRAGIFDVHEHLLSQSQRAERDPDLFDWIASSYLWSDLLSAGMDPTIVSNQKLDRRQRWQELARVLPSVRYTGYMEVCLYAWRDLCGLQGSAFDVENSLKVEAAIREHNRDPLFTDNVLAKRCKMKHVLVDYQVGGTVVYFFGQREELDWYDYLLKVRPGMSNAFTSPYTVIRQLDLDYLHPIVKIDSLFYGWLPQTAEENYQLLGVDIAGARTLKSYAALVDEAVQNAARQGAVGLKSAHNCCRSPVLGTIDHDSAKAALRKSPRELSRGNVVAFENFVFQEVVVSAARYGLPLQIHTGTTYGSGGLSSALAGGAHLLADVIQHNPETTFVLMHGNWPYWAELEQMAKRYPNLFVDLAWSFMLGPVEGCRMLQSMFTTVPCNKFLWGGDCCYVEESYGAIKQAKRVIAAALSCLIDAGMTDRDGAIDLAVRTLCTNGPAVYRKAVDR